MGRAARAASNPWGGFMRGLWGLLPLLLGVGLLACPVNDTVAVLPGSESSGWDAGERDGGSCPTPVRWVEDEATGREVCGARVASRLFTRGVCTCGGLVFSTASTLEGPVGVNGGLVTNDTVTIQGALQVGDGGIRLASRPLSVRDTLLSAGPVSEAGSSLRVGADAEIAGDVSLDSLEVGGVLTLPPNRRFDVRSPPERVRRGPVGPFAPACPCAPLVDVGALARLQARANDNARIALSTEALLDVSDERTVRLECGRFYVVGARGPGRVVLEVAGPSALFVDGDVDLGGLEARLEPGAQLDLLIRGSLSLRGPFHLGSPAAPSHLRLYVGQDLTWDVIEGSTWAGQLYAPRAALALSLPLEASGAFFVDSLAVSGGLRLRYDPDVLELEKTCPE
jgi:hypothetical protein